MTANVVDPGFSVTSRYGGQALAVQLIRLLLSRFASRPEATAETSICLVSSPEVADVLGRHSVGREAGKSAPVTYDEGLARQLWRASKEMARLGT